MGDSSSPRTTESSDGSGDSLGSGGEPPKTLEGSHPEDDDTSSQSVEQFDRNSKTTRQPSPDAWRWETYVKSKTSSIPVTTIEKPEQHAKNLVEAGEIETVGAINKVPDSKEPLYSQSKIQEQAERFCNYLDYIAKDELTDEEKQQLEDVKSKIRDFAEVFNPE